MSLVVRVPAPLRATVGGQTTVPIDAPDLRALPKAITERYPELASRVVRDGAFGPFVIVFVDGEDARYLPTETLLASARVIELLPAVSGG